MQLHRLNGGLSSKVDCIVEQHHAELLAIEPDHADFAGTDFPVDPNERGGRGIAWSERAAQRTLVG